LRKDVPENATNAAVVHRKSIAKKNSNKKVKLNRHQRSMALSHDNVEKREEGRLKLHISKTQRDMDLLRKRLTAWDEVEEQSKIESIVADCKPKKKKGRLGPETWKVRGAARPASEVYSFDTRYVCPHETEHKHAQEKSHRVQNILHLYKGRLGQGLESSSPLLAQTCRDFVSTLMRFGLLNLEAKRYRSAKEAFSEIVDLEGEDDIYPISTARCQLIRMYMKTNRPDSARQLWERLPNDKSVWIRYSAALIEFVSWKILQEKGSTEGSAEALLAKAIQANIFCAYYIAYHDTFSHVVELVEDIEDAEDGSVEQAFEYCNSEQIIFWLETEGAIDWIHSFILRAIKLTSTSLGLLSYKDVDWETKLRIIEQGATTVVDDHGKHDEEPDTLMYAGMFRTSIDMLTDEGAFI